MSVSWPADVTVPVRLKTCWHADTVRKMPFRAPESSMLSTGAVPAWLQDEEIMIGRDAHPAEDDFEHGLQDMHGPGDPGMGMVGEPQSPSPTLAVAPPLLRQICVSETCECSCVAGSEDCVVDSRFYQCLSIFVVQTLAWAAWSGTCRRCWSACRAASSATPSSCRCPLRVATIVQSFCSLHFAYYILLSSHLQAEVSHALCQYSVRWFAHNILSCASDGHPLTLVVQEVASSPMLIDAVQALLQNSAAYSSLVEHPEMAPYIRALRRLVGAWRSHLSF